MILHIKLLSGPSSPPSCGPETTWHLLIQSQHIDCLLYWQEKIFCGGDDFESLLHDFSYNMKRILESVRQPFHTMISFFFHPMTSFKTKQMAILHIHSKHLILFFIFDKKHILKQIPFPRLIWFPCININHHSSNCPPYLTDLFCFFFNGSHMLSVVLDLTLIWSLSTAGSRSPARGVQVNSLRTLMMLGPSLSGATRIRKIWMDFTSFANFGAHQIIVTSSIWALQF